jgi:transposase
VLQRKLVDHTPDQLKLKFAQWNAQAVRALIKQLFLIDLPNRTARKYLSHWGFTPQRSHAVKQWLDEHHPEPKQIKLDQGWAEFSRQLDYKLKWNGCWLIAVAPHNTSRTCPYCGHVSKDNRQTQAQFACVECGFDGDTDVVGAINVLVRGHRVAACGEVV